MINFENIPEDFIFEIDLGENEQLKLNKKSFLMMIENEKLCVSSNGIIYKKPTENNHGIIPSILSTWFDERVKYRAEAKKYELGSEQYEYFNQRQKIQKVLLNSLYGVLGLPSFRFYDLDNAASVTKTGVDLIQFSELLVNSYCNETYNNGDKKDYVQYVDTDSLFVKVKDIILNKYPNIDTNNAEEYIPKILEFAKELQNYINDSITFYTEKFHFIKENYFFIKQEVIAVSGVWLAKKRYALHLINDSGKMCDKIDVKGLDVVRTNFPPAFRSFMKKFLSDILSDKYGKEYFDDVLTSYKDEMKKFKFIEIARPTSAKNISKFSEKNIINNIFYVHKKGTPQHIKAALNYNSLINFYKLNKQYSQLQDGEKIKCVYLKENDFGMHEMAFRGNDDDPDEILNFIAKFTDYEKIFEKDLQSKINDFYEALGWGEFTELSDENVNNFFGF